MALTSCVSCRLWNVIFYILMMVGVTQYYHVQLEFKSSCMLPPSPFLMSTRNAETQERDEEKRGENVFKESADFISASRGYLLELLNGIRALVFTWS